MRSVSNLTRSDSHFGSGPCKKASTVQASVPALLRDGRGQHLLSCGHADLGRLLGSYKDGKLFIGSRSLESTIQVVVNSQLPLIFRRGRSPGSKPRKQLRTRQCAGMREMLDLHINGRVVVAVVTDGYGPFGAGRRPRRSLRRLRPTAPRLPIPLPIGGQHRNKDTARTTHCSPADRKSGFLLLIIRVMEVKSPRRTKGRAVKTARNSNPASIVRFNLELLSYTRGKAFAVLLASYSQIPRP